jgi:hypothetical protein
MLNIALFSLACIALLVVTIFWCAWAYNNNKLSPLIITVTAMIESMVITSCFFYVLIVVFF